MRVYDYKCTSCGNELRDELVDNIDTIVLCKVCNSPMVRQMPSCSFTLTPGAITTHRHKYGNKLPDNYKTSGGCDFGKI